MDIAVVTVGDEILAGDTINTNASWLGQQLTDRGATVARMTTVPDEVGDIARVVNEYRAAYDAVVVTGGLGPTHDDVTMEAVAAAFGTTVEADDDVESWLTTEGGYSGDDLAPKTTHIPKRATMLRNPEGVAPGCVIENVYVFPGVPSEMKAMFELIADEFGGETVYREMVAAAEPESELLDRLQGLQDRFDVTVGSYPGDYVTLKIESTDRDAVERATAWIEDRIESPDSAANEQ
jgi:molybdenum cofactor synthesis domain-containing protein